VLDLVAKKPQDFGKEEEKNILPYIPPALLY